MREATRASQSGAPPTAWASDPAGAAPVAPDWPALWLDLLAARGASDGAGGVPQRLHTEPGRGWCLRGPCSEASAALFGVYKPLLDARLALARGERSGWAVAQLGQSLDGNVATASGDSVYVSGAATLLHLHRLRALCDAVLVGAGTVAADDPQLSTRHVPGPNPVRVVFDPAASLDATGRVWRDHQAPTVWLCDAVHAARARQRLNGGAAELLAIPGLLDAGGTACGDHPQQALAALAARGQRLVLVEGGGVTVSRFLAAGALDRLHLVIAPVLIGTGRRGLQGPARMTMADCPRPPVRTLALGNDILWDLDLRG